MCHFFPQACFDKFTVTGSEICGGSLWDNASRWTFPIRLELVCVRHIPRVLSSLIPERFFLLYMHIWWTLYFAPQHRSATRSRDMTSTSSAYQSIMPLTWRGSTSHMDSSWTGWQWLFLSPCFSLQFYSHRCVMCPVFAQNPARMQPSVFILSV